ncbi:MAG: integrase/recombinase XerC [Cyclobacteriaceae bacterium]|jgi:integrase/recombinase XerC
MINTYLKYLLHEKRYSEHTILSYRNDLQQLDSYILEIDVSMNYIHANHKILRSWIVSLIEKEVSPRSVNRKIATLRSFYKFLYSRELIKANPTLKLKPLKTDKPLPEFIQEKEMDYLFDSQKIPFGEDFSGLRDKMILELFYGTGIRLSELIGVQDESFSLYDQTVKVLGKRNKERVIPLTKEIVNTIRTYIAIRNEKFDDSRDDFLLLTDTGEKCYPMMVYRTVKKYLGYVSQSSKKSPHILRHTFATHLLNKGADLNAVKDLLGHSSLAATQVYTHNSVDKLKSVFDQAHPKA